MTVVIKVKLALLEALELQVLQVRLERLVLQVRRERRGTKENQVLRGGQGSKEARVPLDHLGKEETLGLLVFQGSPVNQAPKVTPVHQETQDRRDLTDVMATLVRMV